MKIEPLKNKAISSFQDESGENIVDMEEGWYSSDDIKAAIEWLKNEIKKNYWVEEEKEYVIPFNELPDVIDEAFEDVTKQK